jgi:protein AATF/BFR2
MTLAQQLKQLESDAASFDPDGEDAALDGLAISREGDGWREHYLDVGPSRLKLAKGPVEQTLLSEKYGGEVRGRMKIFDDDDDEGGGEGVEAEDDREDDEAEDDEDEDDEDDDEDGDEDDDEEDAEEDDESERDENEDEHVAPTTSKSSGTLDPIAALKASRLKDIEKGQGIRRQRVCIPNWVIAIF